MNKKSSFLSVLLFFISLLGYWLLLSLVDRTLFLFSISSHLEQSFFTSFIDTFQAGYKLDFSLASYLMAIPFLFYIFQQLLIKKPVSPWWLRAYVMVPTFLFAGITLVNIPLYASWNEKISKRAIQMALQTPEGLVASIEWKLIFTIVAILVVYFTLAHYFYHWVVVRYAKFSKLSLQQTGITFLLGAAVIFTLIRGGYGRANLNPSVAYYSENSALNHAAVNTYWALLKDLSKSQQASPYAFSSLQQAEDILQASGVLFQSDSIPSVLNVKRPNIVLVLLEGVVGQVFEDLGGEKGITPKMSKLMHQGVLFSRAYSTADRSDKGMIGTLSGFPAQGPESIIKHISKHEHLPAITQLFDSLGYSTSFYHGGQSEFYNFKSFMKAHGIQRIVDNSSFGLSASRVSWGVYDHLVAAKMIEDLQDTQTPFFSMFYTLVNHEPFDLQGEHKFGNDTKANGYRSTVYYTDSVVNDLVEQAKKQDWYDNTLFVVLSDHGHHLPTDIYDLSRPERYHIPLFMFGEVLKDEYKGKVIDQPVSQTDLVTTLWNMVSEKKSPFSYSVDLFQRNRAGMSFINSNNTIGVVTANQAVSYDIQGQKVSYIQDQKASRDSIDYLLQLSKAYYQTVYQKFLNY